VLTVPSKDGTTIAFDWLGAGPAVVLVGGVATTRVANAPLADALAERCTVINYDRRGRGDSGDTPPYSVDREVADLEALISAVGGSACVYGNSSGGALALEAAARGLPIVKLALWEPPFNVDADAPRRHQEYADKLTDLLAEGRRGDAVELFMTLVGRTPKFIAQARRGPWWPATEALAPTLAYDALLIGDSSVPTQRISSIGVPTLVLDSEASPGWAARTADAVAEVLPNARRMTLDGQDHRVAPSVVAPVLIDFFTQ